ncbi:hypothetical protein DSAG12_03284 [Promethearchaeum syntrophicum]|uniref:Uncharacterized protein n=1 Tax=Promethearchaeum syntrophicum TaxID=2594042 RepID=A0A5B9DFG2_9ARCH|nr:hypothetical protein [Candidatus Prometheoarchaeum syntrophicum]QEE17447.1 hypothetical protein DSAG12_03284 [Candidatus Prometheoarchaeum syntrophicum]
MEKKKIVGIIILLFFLSIIVFLVIIFIVWKNALTFTCSPIEGEKINISEYPVVCTEFMPAPFFTQFWIFLKNLFNPITWELIF